MSFPLAAGLALFLETAGPLVAVTLVAWRLRPRAEAGVWAAGPAGVAIGVASFALVLVVKEGVVALVPGLPTSSGLALGLFVGVLEESVRFVAAFALFRSATGRPLVAGALAGLGWGAAEIVPVLLAQARHLPLDAPPAVWLLVPVERAGAILLHVALSGFAVAAAMAFARAARTRAAALFAAAVSAHALLDAWVVLMARRYGAELDAGRATGMIVLEAVFVAGGALALVAAARLRRE